MKSLFVYFLLVFLPIPFLVAIPYTSYSNWFGLLLILYCIPYRITIDGMRLISKGVIKRTEIWKLLLPGQRFFYFKKLYFEK
jgi:hypothetical protein